MKPDCLLKLEVVIGLEYYGVYLRYDVIENHKSTISIAASVIDTSF